MAIINEKLDDIIPSDVFGAEPSTDAGYSRETYTLTLASGDVVNTGRLLIVDDVERTATLADTTTAIVATNKLAIYYGSDLKTNGEYARSNFEMSFAADGANPKGVAITRGDGSGQVYEGFLHLGAADTPASFYHNWDAAVQKAVRAKLMNENRFKLVRTTKPAIAIV